MFVTRVQALGRFCNNGGERVLKNKVDIHLGGVSDISRLKVCILFDSLEIW